MDGGEARIECARRSRSVADARSSGAGSAPTCAPATRPRPPHPRRRLGPAAAGLSPPPQPPTPSARAGRGGAASWPWRRAILPRQYQCGKGGCGVQAGSPRARARPARGKGGGAPLREPRLSGGGEGGGGRAPEVVDDLLDVVARGAVEGVEVGEVARLLRVVRVLRPGGRATLSSVESNTRAL